MIVQFPSPVKGKSFVTSDHHQIDEARKEMVRWIALRGREAGNGRIFAIFDHGQIVREWSMMDARRGFDSLSAVDLSPTRR